MAPLRLVAPGAVTDGVILHFFLKLTTFFIIVSTPTLSAFQVIVRPVLFVNSDAKNFRLSLGCHPLDGIPRGGSSPAP